MRLKNYYTDDEITPNLYTFGGEWMSTAKTEYVGPYHQYTTGETYSGVTWNYKTSFKLIPYENINSEVLQYRTLKNVNKQTYKTPTQIISAPTLSQIESGVMSRFFIKPINNKNIIEIDATQYDDWISKRIDPVLYVAIKLQWFITGPIDDEQLDGVLVRGVTTKNALQVAAYNQTMPGLDIKLSNLTEFYSSATYTVPPDINS